MDAQSSFAGISAALEKLQPRDHLCLIYESTEEQLAAVLPFIRLGLARHEKCVCLGEAVLGQALCEYLRSLGIAPDAAIRSGALNLAAAQTVCMPDGRFDPARVLAFLTDAAVKAQAEGFAGLRVTGDMAWSLGGNVSVDRFLEYEAGLGSVCGDTGSIMLCQYDRHRFSPGLLTAAAQAHALGLAGGKVFRIPNVLEDETAAVAPRDTEFQRFLHALWGRRPGPDQYPEGTDMGDGPRRILDSMCTGVALVSPDRHILHSNRQLRSWFPILDKHPSPVCYQDCNIPPRTEICPYCPCEQVKVDGLPHETVVDFAMAGGVKSFRILASPVRDGAGAITAFVKSMEEVTVRRAAERRLRDSDERHRRITQALTDYVYTVWVKDGRVTGTEHGEACQAVTGYGREDLERDPDLWLKMVAEEDRPAVLEQSRRILAGHPVGPLEHRILRKDGALRWVRNTPVPNYGHDGVLVEYDGVIQDITERKIAERSLRETEEELRQSHKMEAVGKLAGGVAHDFNNLLTVIKGYAALLETNVEKEPQNKADVGEILRASDQAAGLTHQLLAFSRKQILQPEVLDLNKTVKSMAMMLRRLIGEDVKLELSLDPALGQVLMDPVQTQQIILNIAVNSRDAMPQGGVFSIATDNLTPTPEFLKQHRELRPGQCVVLTMTDTGVGMPAEVLARVFEPFFTTKERAKGTGLGLSTVYGIVKQSQGDIVMQSAPGAGTKVEIFLPFAPEACRLEDNVAQTEPSHGDGSETILLVEDDEPVRRLAARSLRARGYKVIEASDAGEAMRLVELHGPEIALLLTDVVMPGTSGRALSDKLCAQVPGLKTLYMSGYTDEVIAQHGVLESGIELLPKPFAPDFIARKVRGVLDS
ncbi:MAG: MEDS domain-containing protein [Elusimicrobiota bacterium]|jgi:PAS domain S-box-containing protein